MSKRFLSLWTLVLLLAGGAVLASAEPGLEVLSPRPPAKPVKLIFIHHSTGEGWLADYSGRLGATLKKNNYFVSDTNYGWGPDSIGDSTDTGHWWLWFRGSQRTTYLNALYKEYSQSFEYARLATDPGGENAIIMFKSCFPNSYIGGKPNDPPKKGSNPLRGQDCGSPYMKVANVKGIYNDLLVYFKTRRDKLFILIASPPLVEAGTDAAHAANARAVHNWLVKTWLKNYPYKNVAVFDFFTVLTSNGGNANKNDLGWATGNHHRFRKGAIQHIQTVANNYCAYGSSEDDSHPTAAGGKKASAEFVSLLNVWYNAWKTDTQTDLTGTWKGTIGSFNITFSVDDSGKITYISGGCALIGTMTIDSSGKVTGDGIYTENFANWGQASWSLQMSNDKKILSGTLSALVWGTRSVNLTKQ